MDYKENEKIELIDKFLLKLKEKVYISEEKLEDIKPILTLFLLLKNRTFPGIKPPRGILFYGPPGTGKTKMMEALAEIIEIKPIIIRGPEIISQYYGKSELRLREIFAEAEEMAEKNGLSIIFIDELDSLAPRRDLTRGELEQRLVGQLLTLMDGLSRENSKNEKSPKGHVIVIGSTNRPEALDSALRRPGRFDFEIEFDVPDLKGRKEILEILKKQVFKEYQFSEDIDWSEIAMETEGFTGADLLQLLNITLLQTISNGKDKVTQIKISKYDIEKNIVKVKPTALREFRLEEPEDKSIEIWNENLNQNDIDKIIDRFCESLGFKPILIISDYIVAKKVVSTIAYKINEILKNKSTDNNDKDTNSCFCNCNSTKYLVFDALRFKSKWYGETEWLINNFFERIKRARPCVVYLKNIDNLTEKNVENMQGAIAEFLEGFSELYEKNVNVLFVCQATKEDGLDKRIMNYFPKENILEIKEKKDSDKDGK